jgi:hypothetical protein
MPRTQGRATREPLRTPTDLLDSLMIGHRGTIQLADDSCWQTLLLLNWIGKAANWL